VESTGYERGAHAALRSRDGGCKDAPSLPGSPTSASLSLLLFTGAAAGLGTAAGLIASVAGTRKKFEDGEKRNPILDSFKQAGREGGVKSVTLCEAFDELDKKSGLLIGVEKDPAGNV
jgi:hypothetical protein